MLSLFGALQWRLTLGMATGMIVGAVVFTIGHALGVWDAASVGVVVVSFVPPCMAASLLGPALLIVIGQYLDRSKRSRHPDRPQ